MAVMLGSLYGALREAGVSEDKAARAAEELVAVNDVSTLKADVSDLKKDVAKLTTQSAVQNWMLGFLLASMIAGFGVVIRLLVR